MRLVAQAAFCQAARMWMPRPVTFVLLAAACWALPAAAADARWQLDPVHTQVVFFADHLGFSHGIGRIRIREGTLRFDAADWSGAQLDVVLDLGSLDMGEEKWTKVVRSAQFLDVERWPVARFTSRSIERKDGDRGLVHGTLSLRGIEKPITLEVDLNRIGRDPYAFRTKAGFTARARVNRFEFGMQRYRDVVGADVELRIEVEAIRASRTREGEQPDGTEEH